MIAYLAVFIGGGFGSLARFGVSKLFYSPLFPLGTLISNILSCLILAITVFTFSDKIIENSTLRFLIVTGFCGGFSTFSAFSYETFHLFKTEYYLLGILNIAISFVICGSLIYIISKLH